MSKFKVSFNLDLSQIAPEVLAGGRVSDRDVEKVVTNMLISEARRAAKNSLHDVRKDQSMDGDVKAVKMAEQIRKMMITLMAEANMSVEALDAGVVIHTDLPFERTYAEDQRRVA